MSFNNLMGPPISQKDINMRTLPTINSKSVKYAAQQATHALCNTPENRPSSAKQITLTDLPNTAPKPSGNTRHGTSNFPPQSPDNTPNGTTNSITHSTKSPSNRITL